MKGVNTMVDTGNTNPVTTGTGTSTTSYTYSTYCSYRLPCGYCSYMHSPCVMQGAYYSPSWTAQTCAANTEGGDK